MLREAQAASISGLLATSPELPFPVENWKSWALGRHFLVWSVNRGPERPAKAESSPPYQDPVISHALLPWPLSRSMGWWPLRRWALPCPSLSLIKPSEWEEEGEGTFFPKVSCWEKKVQMYSGVVVYSWAMRNVEVSLSQPAPPPSCRLGSQGPHRREEGHAQKPGQSHTQIQVSQLTDGSLASPWNLWP